MDRDNCNKDFDTKEKLCPVCGAEFQKLKYKGWFYEKYNPISTFSIIAEVLKKPFSIQVVWLLPIAKIIFLTVNAKGVPWVQKNG